MRYVWLVTPILTCLVLASCASTALQGYEGSARPNDATAVISTRRLGPYQRFKSAYIVSIQLPHGTMPTYTKRARVLPGEMCIVIRVLTWSEESISTNMCFEADAGKTYELSRVPNFRAAMTGLRLVNARTRETVAEVRL